MRGSTRRNRLWSWLCCCNLLASTDLNVEVGETFERHLTNTVERNWGSWDIHKQPLANTFSMSTSWSPDFLYISLQYTLTKPRKEGPADAQGYTWCPKCHHVHTPRLCLCASLFWCLGWRTLKLKVVLKRVETVLRQGQPRNCEFFLKGISKIAMRKTTQTSGSSLHSPGISCQYSIQTSHQTLA